MKLPIAIVVAAASAVACSRDSRPASQPVASAPPARVETAQVSESAPPAAGIPTNNPPVAPPTAISPPADEAPFTLTPASGVGTPRTTSAQLVPGDPQRDRPQTTSDDESIREIRALLAADRALAPMAARVNIVARNGRVWLRGQVNTPEQRAAIEKAARRAAGVIDVNNELVVLAE